MGYIVDASIVMEYIIKSQYLNHTLNIGMKYNLAIYDSSYLALAHHYLYPLITLDVKQEQIARQDGVATLPITNFR